MNPEQDVLDDIDRLVDEQMAGGEPVFGGRAPVCRCGRSWHGLPQTGCPGSASEGPLTDNVFVPWGSGTPGWTITVGDGVTSALRRLAEHAESIAAIFRDIVLVDAPRPEAPRLQRGDRIGYQDENGRVHIGVVAEHSTDPDTGVTTTRMEGEDTPRESGHAWVRMPSPSLTPPMWANNPGRSRRPRRNRNQPNRQGIR
ncbi:hypothetical protein [Rhodococcus sp. B10]|uniref:hypothetical protein n=1 Tax=Rhodococcus sp. B10 TaxID=2695876 RepID=UPI0014316585|nr:hypothetical protein [Rhodococcus sp. B10]